MLIGEINIVILVKIRFYWGKSRSFFDELPKIQEKVFLVGIILKLVEEITIPIVHLAKRCQIYKLPIPKTSRDIILYPRRTLPSRAF